jgi:hypothetical protein
MLLAAPERALVSHLVADRLETGGVDSESASPENPRAIYPEPQTGDQPTLDFPLVSLARFRPPFGMGKGGMGKGSAGVVVPGVGAHDACAKIGVPEGVPCPVKRSHNFCAGPAMLDSAAMVSMWTEFLSWQDSGVSLIEMSQRDVGGPVQTMVADAADNIRKLLDVPRNYRILLFQVRFKPGREYCTFAAPAQLLPRPSGLARPHKPAHSHRKPHMCVDVRARACRVERTDNLPRCR